MRVAPEIEICQCGSKGRHEAGQCAAELVAAQIHLMRGRGGMGGDERDETDPIQAEGG